MKKLLFLMTMILLISINLYPQNADPLGKWTGKWEETCFCGDSSEYMYKLYLFNGTILTCNHVGFYPYAGVAEGQVQTCERNGKVIYKSMITLNYKCFKKIREGVPLDSDVNVGGTAVKYSPTDHSGGIKIWIEK